MKPMRIVLLFPVIILSALILYLSSQSGVPILNHTPPGFDKIAHFFAFFLYSVSSLLFFCSIFNLKKITVCKIFAILLALIFAITDEYHQSLVAGRDASIYDFFADAAGIIVSMFFFNRIINLLKRLINAKQISTNKNRQ